MTIRQSLEQRIISQHANWMNENAPGLRMLDISHLVTSAMYSDPKLRTRLIDDMASQMARDALKRGLAVIALAAPQYRVQEWMGAASAFFPRVAHHQPEWTTEEPDSARLDRDTMVEIKLEAYGFPLAVREV